MGRKSFLKKYITPHESHFKNAPHFYQEQGVVFFQKTFLYNQFKIKATFWLINNDNPRFRYAFSSFCKGASGALLLYDVTDSKSLERLPDWIQIIKSHAGAVPICLVGTKIDLGHQREVTTEKGNSLKNSNQISSFSEISIITGENVDKTITKLLELIKEARNEKDERKMIVAPRKEESII